MGIIKIFIVNNKLYFFFTRATDVNYQIMKFSNNLHIDFEKWSNAKMERDLNKTDNKFAEEDMPK